jgi:hypothetical protein
MLLRNKYMLFTGLEVRIDYREMFLEVLKTARGRLKPRQKKLKTYLPKN